ncbi:4-oxalocrotonate tautomerase [Trichlorobacter thiogenes]|uniref:4-oxalocrotonate tautomerase n=1 Tax=Trichlorobacter thiogenes TaxID=115783 RepID=A0A1T4KC88_9BACT|nr:tautomerase family protein [Trichlorobacter thiogenes]SJZ40068.1 4-oxalocrotonate tautomerase [Trichlorobacter thiogenes]
MPYLNIKVSGEPSQAICEDVARTLTSLTAELLGKKPELTAVVVESVPVGRWFIGGASLASKDTSSFYLEIKITCGTNTKQQKAEYIRAIFSAMEGLLGKQDEASYIVIHEVNADAWGYQGMTQEYRFIAASNSVGGKL